MKVPAKCIGQCSGHLQVAGCERQFAGQTRAETIRKRPPDSCPFLGQRFPQSVSRHLRRACALR
jgi:hypothetical protein